MNEQERLYSYLVMPEASLLNLLDRNFKELLNIELSFVSGWIKNEKCICCKNPDIKNKRLSLGCLHLEKELKKKTKEKEKEINFKSKALKLRNLVKIKRALNSFHTL